MFVQNYGWPTGPAKIWLWLARRPFGWPRATGPAGSTTPDNPALVASIVLKKIYFHGICALSKKNTFNFTRSCAFAQKAKFYALKMFKKQNLTNPNAAKLATLRKMNIFCKIICYATWVNSFVRLNTIQI